jgi:hypothetical protein
MVAHESNINPKPRPASVYTMQQFEKPVIRVEHNL